MVIAVEIILALITVAFIALPFLKQRPEQKPIRVKSIKPHVVAEHKPPADVTEDDIEKRILNMRVKKAQVCPQCGANNPEDARFCSSCAARLGKGRKNG